MYHNNNRQTEIARGSFRKIVKGGGGGAGWWGKSGMSMTLEGGGHALQAAAKSQVWASLRLTQIIVGT